MPAQNGERPTAALNPFLMFAVALFFGGFFWSALGPDADWGNFYGAAAVAIGGVMASLGDYNQSKNWKAGGWACIIIGGACIAGSALKAING